MRRISILIVLFFLSWVCDGQNITTTSASPFCENQNIILSVTPITNITQYQWKINNGDIPGATGATYTANNPGVYSVQIIRSNPDTLVVGSFTVNPLPAVPTFTFSTNSQCASLSFNFSVTSPVSGVTYTWDFGDGTSAIGTSVNHVYDDNNSIGNGNHNYGVSVTAQTVAGCTRQSTVQSLNVRQKPDASLGPTSLLSTYNGRRYFSKCTGAASESFTFTNLSTTTNTAYKIIWGDGSADFTSVAFATVAHVYNVGTNILQFIVSGNGCSDTTVYYVFVGSNPAVGLGNPGNTNICTGTSLTFPISSTSTNTTGTTYLVTFNDGSSPLSYNHPAPVDVTHTFNSISCGINSPGYTNSFSATIQASNPCQTSSATVVPIYVSEKPTTGFTILPNDTLCQNSDVTFTNTSVGNTYVNNGVCNTGNSIWTISPSTGWAISSGSLGNDFGDIDPTIWNSGSSILILRFTQPGTYSIKLKAGNPNCGKDSVIKTICVNPLPVADFTLDQNIGCAPLTVNTTNIPSANNCGNNTYNWDVAYTPTAGCLPNTSAYSFTGGTNANSINPKLRFDNPGIYTLSLTAISPGGSCSSLVVSKIITVKGKPQALINAVASICKGEQINPTVTTDCYIDAATIYNWSFPGGTPATTNINPPGSITYNTSGNYNISVDVTNECGLTTATTSLAVNDVTIAAAGTSQNICGSVVAMAANTATIGIGEWTNVSGPNIPSITNPASPTTTITGLIPGTYVFRWTIANGNCTSQSDVTIIISAGASIANAGTDQDLCLSNSTTLNANTPAIGTGLWSQVDGAAATIAAPANASTSISGLVPGTYVFRWTISFSNCTPNTDDVQVIIYNNPSAANAGTDQTICASSVTLTGNTPAIGNGTWSQIGNTPATANILNSTSASTSVSGLINPGVYRFIWTIANGPCVSTKDTVDINVTEVSTTASAGIDINSCVGSTVTLAGNTATVGTGVWTIVSGPAGATVTNTSQANTSVTGMGVGTYVLRWTITNGNCPASSDDVQVFIFDNPSAANAGTDQTICASSVTLTGNTPAIGTGVWSQLAGGPNLATITNASSPSALVTGLIPGIYKFQWTISNGPCLTKQDTVEINVTEVATTANAGTDIRQCAISAVVLAGNTATVGIGVWSLVSGPAGSLIANTSLPTTGVTGLVPGTYVFRWTITNGNCPPTSDDVQVIVDENVTVANAGPGQNRCGVSVTMAANTPTVGTGQWSIVSGPAGALITNNSLPATTINGLVPGNYLFNWIITNGTCSSSSDVAVTIFAGASAAGAGADQDLCLATTTNLNAVAPTVGTGEWSQVSGPSTAVIANSSGNSTAINGLVPGTYIFRWTVSYSNCTPNTDEVQVTVYNNPTASAAGPDQIICAASTSFAANTPLIGNGLWAQISGPSTATISNVNSSSSSVSDLIPGLYRFKWTITSGPCIASEDIIEINVSAIATTANAGPDSVYCNLSSVILTANVAVVGTGAWSFVSGPNTAAITTPGLNTTSVTGLIPGTYYFRWTITSGVCPPSIDDVEIRILSSLQNIISTAFDTICAGQQAVLNGDLPTGGTGSYLYQWQQSADGISWTDIAGETNQNLSIILSTTTFFQRKVISLPCESFSNTIKIFVQPGITNNIIAPDDSICINTAAPLLTGSTPNGGDGIYSYQWQQSIDGGINWNDITLETGINYNPGILIQTTKYRRLVSTALCSGPQSDVSNVVTVTIHPDSKAIFTATDSVNCAAFDLNTVISVTHLPDSNGIYSWYADNNFIGSNSNGTFAGYTMTIPGDTVDIKLVTASQFGCKPDSMQMQFVTIRTSTASFTKDTTGGCGPLKVNFTNTSNIINPTIQFFWDFGNGINSTSSQPGAVSFVQSPDYRDTVYQVTLKAYNGCDTTVWRDSIKIRSNPKARFGVDTSSVCSNTPILITNNSLGEPNIYYWDFGNGDTDTTFTNGSFSYTYNIGNVVDTFPVRLIAANECTRDTQIIKVRVAPNIIRPQVTVSGSELYGCTPHIVSFINATTGATSFTWDYGDGSPVDVTNNVQSVVTHTFNTPGIFTVTINITNGCSDTVIFKQVTVYAKPIAAFTTDAAQYCLGDTIKVNNTSQDANNYRWFWGDGQSSSGFEPVHVYSVAGSYTILLRAERINNTGLVCLDTFVQSITVLVKPDVRVQSNIMNPLCVPFTLNATAPGIINETVTWYITDTTVTPSLIIQNGIAATYTFNKPGRFTVKMIASNSIGCNDSTELSFDVRGVPQASFTPSAITLCKTDTTVSYQNTTTFNDFGPLTYRWLVDNTPQGINGNFTYRYIATGLLPQIFVTQLIATNLVGCSDTATGTLQMNPDAKAQFVINNPNDCPPFILSVGNVSQYATTYRWFLNGDFKDTAINPSLLITEPLTNYTITVIADNFFGCKPDTFSQSFTSRTKPKAAFNVNDTIGCSGNLNIITTNTSTRASSYVWDWGDATPQTSFISPTHLYNTQGQYIISLVASDATCRDTAYKTVYVSQKPVVDFSVDDSVTCDTARIHFTNLTTGATNYLWTFSDGTTSSDAEPDKSFPPSLSYYTVKLEASNNLGCKDAAIKANLILAKVPPAGDFFINPSPTISIPNYSFSFNNITLDDINYTYQWTLGDGSFESTRDVVHTYNDTGTFAVQMVVFDNKNGCPDTTIKIARIEGQPGYLYVPNAFSPNSLQMQFKTFKPLGKGLAEYRFQVFDAWGKLLFESTQLDAAGSPVEGWDGTLLKTGKPMPQDAYAWRIIAKFRNGRQWDGMSYTNNRNATPGNTFGTVTLFR